MPSTFQRRQPPSFSGKHKKTAATRTKQVTKDVICIPLDGFATGMSCPKGRERGDLAEQGLIGKMNIISTWDEEEVREEVTSVFKEVFNLKDGEKFPYVYLG